MRYCFCCCRCGGARPSIVAVRKSSESPDARASLSPDHLDRNVCARSSRSSAIRRQLSGLPSEVGMGRCQLYFVPVQFVGGVSSDRCGPFRHVRGEPLCATAVRATTVSSRPRSAPQIGAIAAQPLRAGPGDLKTPSVCVKRSCVRMFLRADNQLSQFVRNDVV